eukprot:m.92291 g.92291  ORF g.92291 m.92291 type:complete len:124 (+) comp8641_c0_seq4:46-417(+)
MQIYYFGAGFWGPSPFIVVQYAQRGSVSAVLRSGVSLSWHRRLQFLIDAATGLHALHHSFDRVYVHRDVKCANLLVMDTVCNCTQLCCALDSSAHTCGYSGKSRLPTLARWGALTSTLSIART